MIKIVIEGKLVRSPHNKMLIEDFFRKINWCKDSHGGIGPAAAQAANIIRRSPQWIKAIEEFAADPNEVEAVLLKDWIILPSA